MGAADDCWPFVGRRLLALCWPTIVASLLNLHRPSRRGSGAHGGGRLPPHGASDWSCFRLCRGGGCRCCRARTCTRSRRRRRAGTTRLGRASGTPGTPGCGPRGGPPTITRYPSRSLSFLPSPSVSYSSGPLDCPGRACITPYRLGYPSFPSPNPSILSFLSFLSFLPLSSLLSRHGSALNLLSNCKLAPRSPRSYHVPPCPRPAAILFSTAPPPPPCIPSLSESGSTRASARAGIAGCWCGVSTSPRTSRPCFRPPRLMKEPDEGA
jgi:hypothetical protein